MGNERWNRGSGRATIGDRRIPLAAPVRAAAILAAAVVVVFVAIAARPAAADDSCRPLPRGIAGWWSAEESAEDRTLSALDGIPMGGAAYGPGVVGRAFELDGVDDRIDVPDSPELRPARFTLAAWVRVDVAGEWACILCKQYGNGNFDSMSLWLDNGTLRGGMFGFAEAVDSQVFPVGKAVHVAVTYDESNILLYRDGEIVALANGYAAAIPYDGNQLLIGAEDNGVGAYGAFFDGMIDEPMLFSRALSPCEVRALALARDDRPFCTGDADGDAVPDFQDNCPGAANAGQVDADGDGAGDLCDCAPEDPELVSVDETRDLLFPAKDRAEWCRDPETTGVGTLYDVARGSWRRCRSRPMRLHAARPAASRCPASSGGGRATRTGRISPERTTARCRTGPRSTRTAGPAGRSSSTGSTTGCARATSRWAACSASPPGSAPRRPTRRDTGASSRPRSRRTSR